MKCLTLISGKVLKFISNIFIKMRLMKVYLQLNELRNKFEKCQARVNEKGNYHENWFVKLFNSWKLPAKKVPLSGSLGGEHTGDIKLIINDKEYIVEIKYRAVDKFPSVFKVLQGKDIALYKSKTGDPRWVMIIPDKIFKGDIKMT